MKTSSRRCGCMRCGAVSNRRTAPPGSSHTRTHREGSATQCWGAHCQTRGANRPKQRTAVQQSTSHRLLRMSGPRQHVCWKLDHINIACEPCGRIKKIQAFQQTAIRFRTRTKTIGTCAIYIRLKAQRQLTIVHGLSRSSWPFQILSLVHGLSRSA